MSSQNPYPKIILVLGGGGARGFAHIGVLQVLMETGIKISGIVGTSMGALIGSTFASGTDLYYLEKVIDAMSWENLVDLRLPSFGLIDGNKIKCLIDLLTKGKNFNELDTKLWVVATNLLTGEEVIFKEGPLAPAVRASISIPGIFNPVEHQGQILVDGAVVAGVPVEVAKMMNGDITIAVNVSFDHTHHRINNVFDVLAKVMDIMGNRLDALQMSVADVTIVPELGGTGVLHFHKAKECIAIGREAAKKALPKIMELIDDYSAKPKTVGQLVEK
ncbi:MAG TPA: patatin-like phospholipase family protein [Bacillota bacterium]|jgi:NTE family protein|nr:patatin-like phospholipase family protein [Bacillota bacterium]HOL09325.1 patatin-like phospholipase family protein [Bacillota bacterium]HPO97644.1 patatin-like phospholipase family protein [Bacillota bacterium]